MLRLGLTSLRAPLFGGLCALGALDLARRNRPMIRNDTTTLPPHSVVGPGDSLAQAAAPVNGSRGGSRFGGKLDYHQLTFGSFAGLISGYLVGKVSRLLVFMVVSTVITTEYLSSAGWINLRPFYTSVFKWSSKYLNQEILVEDPSFKLSFSAAFLIAAFNA